MDLQLQVCKFAFVLFTSILLLVPNDCLSEYVNVNTKGGIVRGTRTYTDNNSWYLDTFFGIPFAKPPVGALRFTAPQPADPWTGTRDALKFGAMCPQDDKAAPLPMNEDCLYLNVYAPKPPTPKALPVMVWIHGGSYRTGTGAFYNGTELARQGVVVVTINYRLDILGFLSTEDTASSGNFGLQDQIMTLKWVKDNIASFQGDPNDVTIFGESAGSGSVSLLKLSPLAKGLFHKAIMESGVSLSPWAVAQSSDPVSPLQHAKDLAKRVGCSTNTVVFSADVPRFKLLFNIDVGDNAALVECLRKTSVADLIKASAELLVLAAGKIIFPPVVETVVGVIPDSPRTLLAKGVGSDVISIRGVNKDEYGLFVLHDPLAIFSETDAKALIFNTARSYFSKDAESASRKIVSEYFSNFTTRPTHEQIRQGIIRLFTDFDFIVPTVIETNLTVNSAGHAPQFLYEFTYRATLSTEPQWAGVMHASELPFVFGQPFIHDRFFTANWPYNWTAQDETVSLDMVVMWTNFAKFGNPTPPSVSEMKWPEYTVDGQSYLDIELAPSIQSRLLSEKVQFWQDLFRDYGLLL